MSERTSERSTSVWILGYSHSAIPYVTQHPHTPPPTLLGTFTNQIQRAFKEPRLLVISDPRADHQPITESACVNIPVIAFCNTDSPLKFVDIAIPCNTKVSWFFLAVRSRIIKRGWGRSSVYKFVNRW